MTIPAPLRDIAALSLAIAAYEPRDRREDEWRQDLLTMLDSAADEFRSARSMGDADRESDDAAYLAVRAKCDARFKECV